MSVQKNMNFITILKITLKPNIYLYLRNIESLSTKIFDTYLKSHFCFKILLTILEIGKILKTYKYRFFMHVSNMITLQSNDYESSFLE